MESQVQIANRDDFPRIVEVLARAFCNDPVAKFAFPDSSSRELRLKRFFNLQLRYHYRPRGEIYTNGDLSGAAMWLPPRRIEPTVRDVIVELPLFFASVAQSAVMIRLARLLGAHHPRTPHYYLGTIAVDPTNQGSGIGTALLAPVLRECDTAAMPAYLESSSEQNNEFYSRLGFVVTNQLVVPRGGPPIWLMWREPVKASNAAT